MDISNASLNKLAVHYIGNKNNGDPLVLSKKEQLPDKETRLKFSSPLLERCVSSFERYSFHHSSSLNYNEVYNFVSTLFSAPEEFHEQSALIASHLYESSLHPKIKAGELYVAHFTDIGIDEKMTEAIGLFKAETKALFIELDATNLDLELQMKEGLELSKIDKGCLILNTNTASGYDIIIFDRSGKGEEAQYWKDKFLGVMIRQNEFVHTQEFLTITKNYVTSHLPEEFEVSKPEQIDILNRSMDYFKTHESFDKDEFEKEVLHHEEIINSFRKYDQHYRQANEMDAAERFDISPHAVKKQARIFKSVIKLDKNFHIYIHGNKELIEKGYDDELKKSFYKIYFDQEM